MPITLTVTAGPHIGRIFTFAGHDAFLVGRSKRAHFRLAKQDKYFSRLHFMVEVNPPRCGLMDMGSRNGTFVNGKEVGAGRRVDLADGDRIAGGDTVLHVAFTPDAAEGPTVDVAPAPPSVSAKLTLAPAESAGSTPPIPGYRIVRELGRGGMGVVHLAVREADGVRVALKTIRPAVLAGRKEVARFLREADILRQLDHPNIVAFRDMGESGGQLYFVMDFVEGIDAGGLLKEHGPLPAGRAALLVCQLLEALDYAHGRGFVHRDVKPANLLLGRSNGREEARLADFGLARVYGASRMSGLTMAGDVGGSLPFMAPEQVTNYREARPAADQYAAAATLYNLLTNRYTHDFPRGSHERLQLLLEAAAVPIGRRRPDIPAPLAAVVHRALAKEPADRFPDARAMGQALRRFCRPSGAKEVP